MDDVGSGPISSNLGSYAFCPLSYNSIISNNGNVINIDDGLTFSFNGFNSGDSWIVSDTLPVFVDLDSVYSYLSTGDEDGRIDSGWTRQKLQTPNTGSLSTGYAIPLFVNDWPTLHTEAMRPTRLKRIRKETLSLHT